MSFEISIHITSSCYIMFKLILKYTVVKMEGAVTDKLSSCTTDEGAWAELTRTVTVWKLAKCSIVEWKNRETLAF